MKTRNPITTLLLILLIQFVGIAQKLDIQNIERITLATDRNLYVSGEPIWFSANYSIPGNTSVTLSKVLYVDLYDNDNQIVASQKLLITNGLVTGSITLPQHLTTGYYILRAYTRYQENFPVWQFTSIVISVVNPYHPLNPVPMPNDKDQFSIGVLANGNIAFSINEPLNSKVKNICLIVDGINTFDSAIYYPNGLGSFNYQIDGKKDISLKIILESGDSLITISKTVNISIVNIIANINLDKLALHLKSLPNNNEQFELLITNTKTYNTVSQKVKFINDSAIAKIPLSKIGTGLILVLIKNIAGKVVAQTAYFIPQEQKTVQSNITNINVVSGEPIYINLSSFDANDFPMTVSITRRGTNNNKSELLPKYLIDNPIYLSDFLSKNPEFKDELLEQISIAISLKLKMLQSIITHVPKIENIITPELFGLTLQGNLINPKTKQPITNEVVYASVLGTEKQFHAAISSNNGRFVIPIDYCNNQKDIYLETNMHDENKLQIMVDNGFSNIPPDWSTSYFVPDTSIRELVTQLYFNNQINGTFNIARQKSIPKEVSNLPIFGNNLKQIKLSDYIQLTTTSELFNELVPNVRVRKKNNHYEFVVFNDNLNLKYFHPLVLVDLIPYHDIDKLMALQPTKIEQIDVSNHEYVYGNIIFKGIIMIQTNTNNFSGLPLSQIGVFVEYETFKPDVEFVPFSKLSQQVSKPNFANTVYWKLISNKTELKNLTITAPHSIAKYDLLVISLKNKTNLTGSQVINVIDKQ